MSFDYAKNPIQAVNFTDIYLQVNDPDIVQEMYTTKNAQIDKTGVHEGVTKNFFGKSFLFSKTDDVWKKKRKGLGHAFYKDRLIVLLDNLKDCMKKKQDGWLKAIHDSPSGVAQINLSDSVLGILEQFLAFILLGIDNEELYLDVMARKDKTGPYEK